MRRDLKLLRKKKQLYTTENFGAERSRDQETKPDKIFYPFRIISIMIFSAILLNYIICMIFAKKF